MHLQRPRFSMYRFGPLHESKNLVSRSRISCLGKEKFRLIDVIGSSVFMPRSIAVTISNSFLLRCQKYTLTIFLRRTQSGVTLLQQACEIEIVSVIGTLLTERGSEQSRRDDFIVSALVEKLWLLIETGIAYHGVGLEGSWKVKSKSCWITKFRRHSCT